jgi:ankyrin repeat protein
MRGCRLSDRPLGELPLKEIFKNFDDSAGALEAHLRASYSADLLEYPYFQAVSAQMWGELLEDLVERKPHRRSLPLSGRPLFTILHLLALLGLEVEAKIWLSISPSHAFLKDGRDNTPFQLAVSGGHVTLASSLLDVQNFRIEARKIPQAPLLDLSLAASSMEPLDFLVSQDLIDLTSRYGDQHDTPLMVACRRSNVPAARFLLSRSSLAVNERNDAGETALIIATGRGCLEAVELLLSQKDVDINAQFANFESALSISVKEGHEQVANLLLDEPTLGQEQLGKGLIAATEASRTRVIRKILQTGRVDDSTGNAALLIAARRGQGETVEALLEFDVNMIDENGERLLNSAIRRGNTGIVQALARAKTLDINHNPGIGSREAGPRAPALHLAATLGSAEIVKLLLRNESLDVNQIDSTGLSALHLAVLYAQLPVMETLLACPRVDVNITTTNALKTPLHLAVKTRSTEMVRMLLARPGLKPNQVDSSIRTPLMMTTESRFYSPQVVRDLLSDPRLDVNFANAQGDTALHHAANHANVEVAQDLLQHVTIKADIRNGAGLTPRKIAEKGRDANSRALAKLLSRHGTSRELSRWFS